MLSHLGENSTLIKYKVTLAQPLKLICNTDVSLVSLEIFMGNN